MKLKDAIQSLIETKGLNILKAPMSLNILSDYNAFSDYPSSKNVLKNIISEGYLDKIAFFYDNNLPISEDTAQTYLSDLYNKLGFRKDISAYVLNALFESLGFAAMFHISDDSKLDNFMFENSSGQTSNSLYSSEPYGKNHLEFKGISINGSMEQVAERLKQQGYQEIDRADGCILLTGKFAGKEDCQILVSSSKHTGQTYSIAIFTPASLNWWSIKADYEQMKTMLTKKYGKPSSSTEFFSDPYEEGDGYELTAFSSGNAFFVTKYATDLGEISVCITNNAQLLLSYNDKINGEEHNTAESIAAENDL